MADMITVLNTIRANASAQYQERVPEATRENIADVGNSVMEMKITENEFLTALVNKIAMTMVHNKTFNNPLKVLKKGGMPLGRNIEEIYTNPITGTTFDPSGSKLLERAIPDTKTIYHELNRKGQYKATITKAQLISAFRSYEALEQLLNSIVNAIYSGDNFDEFMLMKELFASAITGGKIKKFEIDAVTDRTTAKEFVKSIKTIGSSMSYPTSDWNSYKDVNTEDTKPVITWTPKENQVLIIRNDVAANVDVELLAQAFNVSYTDLKQRTLEVDGFGSSVNCGAILCDSAYVQVYDQLQQMESFHNGEGLYDNYIYHHWQMYSLSLFANAVAFMFPEGE